MTTPDLAECIAQVAHLTTTVAELRSELARLRDDVVSRPASGPADPPGWVPSNYTATDHPSVSLCRDCATERWNVWSGSGGCVASDVDRDKVAAQALALLRPRGAR